MKKFAHIALGFVALFTVCTLTWLVMAPPPDPSPVGAALPAIGLATLSQLLVNGLVTAIALVAVGVTAHRLVRLLRRRGQTA